MRTHVSFQKTSVTLDGDDLPLGRDVATPVMNGLIQRGWKVNSSELEWAFDCDVERGRYSFHLLIGIVDDGVRQWLIFVDSNLGRLRRLFGADDTAEHKALIADVAEILAKDSEASSIRWYTAEDWNAAPDDRWSPVP